MFKKFVIPVIIFLLLILPVVFFIVRPDLFLRRDRILANLRSSLGEVTGRRVHAEFIEVNLALHPRFDMKNFKIANDGELPVLSAPKASLQMSLFDLWRGDLRKGLLTLSEPEIYVSRDSEGDWNWLRKSGKNIAAENTELPGRVLIQKGTLIYVDQTEKPEHKLTLVQLETLVTTANISQGCRVDAYGFVRQEGMTDDGDNFIFSGIYQRPDDALFSRLSLGDQRIMWEGVILSLSHSPAFQGKLDFSPLEMKGKNAFKVGRERFLDGTLSLEMEGTAAGTHPSALLKSLTASGAMDVRTGNIYGHNLLRDSLEKVVASARPGFGGLGVRDGKPELQEKELPFELLQGNINITRDKLEIVQGMLKGEGYIVEFDGEFRTAEHTVEMKGKQVFLPSLADDLIARFPELQPLRNSADRIVYPVYYSGLLPGAVNTPDMQYVRSALENRSTGS